jgi:hypothetical protein
MDDDPIAAEIEADLRKITAAAIARAGDRRSWISCNVVVIEDMGHDPVGWWAEFRSVPHSGEWITGVGKVEQVHHTAVKEGEGAPPTITLFVRRTPLE